MTRAPLVAALLFACAPKAPPAAATAPLDEVVVVASPLDGRAYRWLRLDNGLQALLISDPDTDMAAASLIVDVGHYADPEDRQGLAHFLEHMLFMGTDRYPEADEYRKFVEDHGGSTNAGTSGETTQYHFQVEHTSLQPAFDRFARFFVAPVLDPGYVERERNAVNAEYSLKIQDAWRRGRQVRKVTSNPAHPEHKFSVGNLDTLADRDGDPVYEDLRALYEAEYRPDRMAVAILGREPLDELGAWVTTALSEVPGEPVARAGRPPPFAADQLGVRIDIVPLDERRELELQFPLPPQLDLWPSRPHSFLSAVLGHEGEGTLFDQLKALGWIERLSVASSSPADDHDLLSFTYGLTEGGAEHLDDIVAATFQAVDAVRAGGLESFRHDEMRTMSELGFRYAEETRPVSAVRSAARTLLSYPPEHALDAWATWEDFRPELVQAALDRITVDNLRMIVTVPGLETSQVEPLYDVPWDLRPLTDAERARFGAGTELSIALPTPNPYLPRSTELVAAGGAVPARLSGDGEAVQLWAQPDPSFGVPRAWTGVQIWSAAPRSDGVRSLVLTELLERVITDDLQGLVYPVELAGLDFSLSGSDRGLFLRLQGYDDRQEALLRELLERARGLVVDPERFEVERARLVRGWRNLKRERPLSQVRWAADEALDPFDYDRQLAIPVAEALTPADLQAFADTFFDGASARLLVHGNLAEDEARALAAAVGDVLDGAPAPRPEAQVRLLAPGTRVVLDVDVDHDDSTLVVLVQGTGTDVATHARWAMLGQLLDTPFFTELRTEQQLGYSVGAGYRTFDLLPGLQMAIQSAVAGPVTLEARVDAFLRSYQDTLAAMPEDEFATIRDGLVTRLTEEPTQLFQQSSRLASDLDDGVLTFDWRQQLADEVATLERDELAALYDEVLLSEQASRLVARSFGRHHADEATDPGCADTSCVVEQTRGPHRRPL